MNCFWQLVGEQWFRLAQPASFEVQNTSLNREERYTCPGVQVPGRNAKVKSFLCDLRLLRGEPRTPHILSSRSMRGEKTMLTRFSDSLPGKE